MKVICEIGYQEYYTSSNGIVLIEFKKGEVYDAASEYENCFLFYYEDQGYLIKKIYFMTIEQVFKRRLLSIHKK